MGLIVQKGVPYPNSEYTIHELTDVDDSNKSEGSALVYNAANSKYESKVITKSLTWAEYQALSEEEKNNGTAYFITDVNGDGQNFQPVIYSEEEREIGVWTDGKPLYEKTLVNTTDVSTSNNAWSSVSWSNEPSNIDKFINAEIHSVHEPNVSAIFRFSLENGHIVVASKELTTFLATDKVTIRYTKTTDTAGSGIWTPQGVPAVHYSEDEHVVGTWTDGRTVYEKTLNVGAIGSGTSFAHGITNLDWIIDYSMFGLYAGSNKLVSPANGSSSSIGFVIASWNSTNITFTKGNLSSNFSNCYCTIRYIKSSS